MTEDRREYARRLQRAEHSPNFADDPVVRDMLLQLVQLERQTDPQRPDSEHDKDASANKVLRTISDLCAYVAGWAIDHKIGLAIEGLGNIPDLATQTRTPDYNELRESVNSHRHEAARQSRDLASGVQRKALSNLTRRPRAATPTWRRGPQKAAANLIADQMAKRLGEPPAADKCGAEIIPLPAKPRRRKARR